MARAGRIGRALVLPLALSSAGCAGRAQRQIEARAECEVMLAVTRAQLVQSAIQHRRAIFVMGDQHDAGGERAADAMVASVPQADDAQWIGEAGGIDQAGAPDRRLLRRWWAEDSAGYRPCDRWTALLRASGSGDGRAAAGAMMARSAVSFAPGYTADVVTLSRPVVDAFGTHAAIEIAVVSGPMAGGGFVLALQPGPSGWREAASFPLWIA